MRSIAVFLLLAVPCAAEVAPDRARELEHIVRQDCGSCHGLSLRGGLGRPLTAEALAHTDPQSLAQLILDGVPGTAMPPWRPLITEVEALWIARYLKQE